MFAYTTTRAICSLILYFSVSYGERHGRDNDQVRKMRYRANRKAPVFHFLTSLDKVFKDVYLFRTILYKKTRKNCEEISIKTR